MNNESVWIGLGAVALLAIVIVIAVKDNNRWQQFKIDHKCVVTERKPSSVSYGYDSKGNGHTITNPSQTAWKCDDGVTYWR